MSKSEIMEFANRLADDERIFLFAYLKHLSRAESSEYERKLSALNEEFFQGKSFTQEEVERLHAQLSNEGH